jgi:exodeoxyribonuclease-1
MTQSLFFYDLETSGINPREQRIMQFAGQRTDMELNLLGEPFNIIIRLTDDVLPDPDAILITGITPQKTKSDGVTEAEFLKTFHAQIATPGTIFVGFNTIRFDDEFMRYLHYRNFYDPYEWHWLDGKSRWDILDVVRMTRALRPDGIKWPVDAEGRPTCRLELITKLNGLDHQKAHDALNDVLATIAVAKLIREKQPKLFQYLLSVRKKDKVEGLVTSGQPFVYSSGKYSSEFDKTTVALYLGDNPKTGALVYDLRRNPTEWLNKRPEELVEAWKWKQDKTEPRMPVKTLQYNRCPAVAPLGVLDDESKQRLKIDMAKIESHAKILADNPDFYQRLIKALTIMNKQQQTVMLANQQLVDAQLYDDFFASEDKTKMRIFRASDGDAIFTQEIAFKDKRLNELLPLYKARNYATSLSDEERSAWEDYRKTKLLGGDNSSRAARYFKRLSELNEQTWLNQEQRFLLEELQLYGESMLPEPS